MPGYSNPQNLNRYSYVTNNPLRYTDPTGHMQVADGPQSSGCSNPIYCQNGKPKPPTVYRKPKNKGGNSGIGDGPTIGPSQVIDPTSNISPTISPLDEIFQIINYGTETMDVLDLVEDAIQWGRPVYRQIKYAAPLGGLEYGVDAALQLHDDRNLSLFPNERLGRAVVRGFESYIADGASTLVGGAAAIGIQAGFPEAPGVAAGLGYAAGSYSTSAILDNAFMQNNPTIFSWFGLGGP